jgi:transcriptional regulator with XRE-family HTH domain
MFVSNIDEILSKDGRKTSELVLQTGISQAHLWKLRRLPCNPTLEVAAAIASALNRGISEVFLPLSTHVAHPALLKSKRATEGKYKQ